jgi:hypothetical protein
MAARNLLAPDHGLALRIATDRQAGVRDRHHDTTLQRRQPATRVRGRFGFATEER